MNSDDDPPSRAAQSSSRNSYSEPLSSFDFAGGSDDDGRATRPTLTTRQLLAEPTLPVSLSLLGGLGGLDRPIFHTRIQKSGLALAGHFHGIVPERIQILGRTEQSYLEGLSEEACASALRGFFGLGLSMVVLTGELSPAAPMLIDEANRNQTPLVHSLDRSSVTITSLHALLDERLAPRRRLHGVLIDVFGVGLLLFGASGVGKSECALDLVMRGHRLVADDVVDCDFRPPGMVFGAPAKVLRHHLEVRGLGILNIKDLFGVTSIRERKRIDVVVRLVSEDQTDIDVDRLGLEDRFHTILGVAIPEVAIPVRPGRDMASILEVAARNELLKNAGHHAARELLGAIESQMGGRPAGARGPGAIPFGSHRGESGAPATRLPGPRPPDERLPLRSPRTDESSAPPPVQPKPRGEL